MAPRNRVRAGRGGRKATKAGGKAGVRRRKRRSRKRTPKHGLNLARVEQLIFKYTNSERTMNILRAYSPLAALTTAARGHARWMARMNRLSHTGKGGSTHQQRVTAADSKLANCGASENVGQMQLMITTNCSTFYNRKGSKRLFCDTKLTRPVRYHSEVSLAKAIVKAWMNSSGHRANILHQSSKFLGVGAAVRTVGDKPDWTGFFVQNFSLTS